MSSVTEIKKSFVLTKKQGDKVNVYVYDLADNFDEKTTLNLNNESEFEFYNIENDNVSNKSMIKYGDVVIFPTIEMTGKGLLKKRQRSKKGYHKRIKIKTVKFRNKR